MQFIYKNHTVSVRTSETADESGWLFTTTYYSADDAQLRMRDAYSDHKFNTQEEAEQAGAAAGRDAIDGLISGA